MTPSSQTFDDKHAVKCELASEVLRSSGRLRLKVTGWSMLPSVWPGDTLVVESVSSEHVSEGDIVLFGRDRRLFAHRVVPATNDAQDRGILTRGDAMPQPDAPVSANELLGRVTHIERNGKCIEPSKSLRFSERAVAALVRRSDVAARVVVGVHGMRQGSPSQL
jgi:signal peptidase I